MRHETDDCVSTPHDAPCFLRWRRCHRTNCARSEESRARARHRRPYFGPLRPSARTELRCGPDILVWPDKNVWPTHPSPFVDGQYVDVMRKIIAAGDESDGVGIRFDSADHLLGCVDDSRRARRSSAKDFADPPLRIVDLRHAHDTIEKLAPLRRIRWTDEQDDAMTIAPAAGLAEEDAAKFRGGELVQRPLR